MTKVNYSVGCDIQEPKYKKISNFMKDMDLFVNIVTNIS